MFNVNFILRTAATGAIALSAATVSTSSAMADEVLVFAAASMTNAMAEIEERFEAASDHDIVVSLAGSSALARQI